MGIFNEQSFDHPFARGIHGAPGVGFSLTADGNYDMNKKRLTNVGAPNANTDAATKKYADDNSSGSPATSQLTVDSNIDMKNTYRILKLKSPSDADEPATKQYADGTFLDRNGSHAMIGDLNMNNNKIENVKAPTSGSDASTKSYTDNLVNTKVADYLKLDGTVAMTGDLDMDGNQIFNLPSPQYINQPTTLAFTNLKYVARDGSSAMTNNLNMDNKKIVNLRVPTDDKDAATKKYVDDKVSINGGALANYLKKDGTTPLTDNLNLNSHKIINLSTPTSDTDATNKEYVDKLNHEGNIQPSHYNDQFSYLMSSSIQWTDEIDGGTSFNITRIGDLAPTKGSFHDYNHKVLYIKNSQGGYKYKMGINFYRLTANADYTFCLEILNTDYQLWHKSQTSVDRGTSQGLTIGNVSVRKYSHRYLDPKNQPQFMYYHRIIVNFRKTKLSPYFLHILVNIPQDGTDLAAYPKNFSGVYMIAYGIIGTASNIDPDKTYDYHTAFDILPTEVVYNVGINTNHKEIRNIKLDRMFDNNAAIVGFVKEVIPFTKYALYKKHFVEFYDFADADSYVLSSGSSHLNSLNPNITLPNKDLSFIKKKMA